MTEWREVPLGEVIELKRGYDLPKRVRNDGPFPIVSSSGISGSHVEAKVPGPGVVTGRYGTLGQVFFITGDFWPLNTSLYVRDFKGNNARFVALLLESMDLAQHDGAAAVPGLNRNQLHTVPVHVPDRAGQDKIATIVEAIDELIDNNRRRVEHLEAIARAVYREWFVHFRYPGYEDVPLVDSSHGQIPTGWQASTVGECASALVDGDWIETKDQGGSDYRLLQVSNIAVGRFRETGKFRYVTEETFRRLRCTAIKLGDLLVSRMPDPIGRSWLVDDLPGPAITAVDVAILTPRTNAMGTYLDQFLSSHEHLAWAETVATGTTRKRLSRSVLSQEAVLLPTDDVLEQYQAETSAMRSMATELRGSVVRLGVIRDLLLPRLVSGQIDVSNLDLDTLTGAAVA